MGDVSLDLRVIADVHDTLFVVDLGGFGFVEVHVGGLLTEDVTDRLHDGAVLDQTSRAGGEERSEKEVVARRDDDNIVVLSVQLLQQGNSTPAGTWVGK